MDRWNQVKIQLASSPLAPTLTNQTFVNPNLTNDLTNAYISSNKTFFANSSNLKNFMQFIQHLHEPADVEVIQIPIEIFHNSFLSGLEAIVKYFVENRAMSFNHISHILCRSYKTVWGAYHDSKSKMPQLINLHSESRALIPSSILVGRDLGIFESIVFYLKNELKFRYCNIARMLCRDQRTVWVSVSRANIKRRSYA